MSELARRLVHVSGTALPALYLLGVLTWQHLQWLLVFGALVALVLEVLRLYVGLDWRIFRELTREYEQDNPAGYALYMVSQTAVALVFPPYVAVAGMLMLTIGDPISGVLGSNRGAGAVKRVGVLVAMFAVCFLLAVPIVSAPADITLPQATLAAALGALGATIADGVKPVVAGYVVDDNLSIPPLACLGIWLGLLLWSNVVVVSG
ncbi:MAG: dolichol kinase [Halobacteriota archaeon]